MDDTEYYMKQVVFDGNQKLPKTIQLAQTLHGDGIYVTIFWTSPECGRQVCSLDK